MPIDWTVILLALIAGAPATIAALGALLLAWLNRAKLDQVQKATDGLATKLAASERQAGFMEGEKSGILQRGPLPHERPATGGDPH